MKVFTCKQVSTALAEKDYRQMTRWEQLGVHVHVALCAICGKYNRMVMDTHDMFRCYRQREDEDRDLPDVTLDPQVAEKIKSALRADDAE